MSEEERDAVKDVISEKIDQVFQSQEEPVRICEYLLQRIQSLVDHTEQRLNLVGIEQY